jgi:hypothetical protein
MAARIEAHVAIALAAASDAPPSLALGNASPGKCEGWLTRAPGIGARRPTRSTAS